ncbi:hypothetical protein BLAT2472_20189 [Burkholderia latens]
MLDAAFKRGVHRRSPCWRQFAAMRERALARREQVSCAADRLRGEARRTWRNTTGQRAALHGAPRAPGRRGDLGVYTYADTDIAGIQDFIGRLSDLFID